MPRQTLRTRPIPKALEGWLRLVNGIPDHAEVDRVVVLCCGITSETTAQFFPEHFSLSTRQSKVQELRGALAKWGSSAVEYLLSNREGGIDPLAKLTALLAARDAFYAIAKSESGVVKDLPLPVDKAAALYIEAGVIKVSLAPFLRVLDGIEARRIRLCPVCEKLFWAGRVDKVGCTEECSRVLRQRRLRENRRYKKAHPSLKYRR